MRIKVCLRVLLQKHALPRLARMRSRPFLDQRDQLFLPFKSITAGIFVSRAVITAPTKTLAHPVSFFDKFQRVHPYTPASYSVIRRKLTC